MAYKSHIDATLYRIYNKTMINKTDLRIGNSVSYKGIVFVVDELDKTIITLFNSSFGWKILYYSDIHPIPITEEALVIMGFEKQENNWKRLTICEDSSYLYWEKLAGIKLSVDNESIFIPYVNSIHRLQNIIYSLTQTELLYHE